MQTIYFEIRHGDIAIYYDKNDNFIGADITRFGEFGRYSKEEKEDFIAFLKYLKGE